MSIHAIRSSFNVGEISPYALGRVDLEKYNSSCEGLWNYLPLIQGPVTRRPGTRYVVPAMGASRLIPFVLTATTSYVLEFGNQTMRVYKNGAQVGTVVGLDWNPQVGGTTPDGATLVWTTRGYVAWPGASKSVALGLVIIDNRGNLQQVTTAGTTGENPDDAPPPWSGAPGATTTDGTVVWTCLGLPQWAPATAYSLNAAAYTSVGIVQVTTAGTSSSGGGTTPYQITTPYNTAADNLWDIKFAQEEDIMYLVHPNHPPQKLSRLGDADWVMSQPAFRGPPIHAFDQDVGSPNADHSGAITLTPGAASGLGVTFTASAGIFIAGDVGKQIISGSGIAYITAVGGTQTTDPNTGATLNTEATCDILDAFAGTAAIAAGSWLLRGGAGSFIAYGAPGSTAAAFTYSQHLGLGGADLPCLAFTKFPQGAGNPTTAQDTFRMCDIGRYLISNGAVGQITGLTNANLISVRLLSAIIDTLGVADADNSPVAAPESPGAWDLEDPCFTPANGYPTAVCFFQDRLCFAGTLAQPQSVWMSVTDDYENFCKGPNDDNALDETINSGNCEQIQWLAAYQGMIAAGTFDSEYILTAGALVVGGNGPAITPSNFAASLQSRYGVSSIQPIFVENDLIYIQRAKQTAYQFSYDIYRSVYGSKNLSLLADLITTAGFKEMVYAARPFFNLWFTTLDGNLIALTYMREQEVVAWSRHFTGQDLWSNGGASFRDGERIVADSPPAGDAQWPPDQVISVCSIPDPSGLSDQVWMVTQRTILNQVEGVIRHLTVYNVEVMDPSLYVDAGSSAAFDSPVTSIGNLSYLWGRNVRLNVDGADIGLFTVPQDGEIDFQQQLPNGGSAVQVGLPFTPHCETTRLEVPAGGQTSQGLLKRWTKIWARLYQQIGGTINTEPIVREEGELGNAQLAYTGDTEVRNLGADRDGRVTFEQPKALPSTVLAIFGTVDMGAN